MPSFNYDFCKGKPFNLKEDISQVGTLSEYFRQEIASWRSSTPVFSFSGTGVMPQQELGSVIDPFDDTSLFGFLNKNNGLLMHYGSAFQATTLIHYAERISGNLIYRYNKKFNGLICDAKNYEVTLNYHVIPKNVSLVYDWAKLERHLLEKKSY